MTIPMFSKSVHDMMVNDSQLVDLLIYTDEGINGLSREILELASHNNSTLNYVQLAYQVTCVYRNLCFILGVDNFLKYCANIVTGELESLEDMTAIVENVSGYYSGISCEFGFCERWEDMVREWKTMS